MLKIDFILFIRNYYIYSLTSIYYTNKIPIKITVYIYIYISADVLLKGTFMYFLCKYFNVFGLLLSNTSIIPNLRYHMKL